MDKLSHPHYADGPPTDESSSSSSHYPRDIRSYFINWHNDPCHQLLYTEQMKKLLSARQIEVGKVCRLIEERISEHVLKYRVGYNEKLSAYRIPNSPGKLKIGGIIFNVSVRCAPYKPPKPPSGRPEISGFVRSSHDSGGLCIDGPGGQIDNDESDGKPFVLDETLFAALARELMEETGQELNFTYHELPPKVWCKFKNKELQVHVSYPVIVVLPDSGWEKEITLSEEHEEWFWIAEDAMDNYKFHGTNKAIFLEAFEYMGEHQKTIQ
ncbi:hypothetical protein BDV33DRAFT_186259 [Aspergillus novoparasiticus]|uniref:Nudix hydrolase domain-containing protein n=1 Tax=Aspergillus novoparasiticus TaxID=986946 RepID=A0A5N6E7H0_9EURO|nr:hypothetical protein BDV33DRAFT_186259 [Aspergillus novoparasiticus]